MTARNIAELPPEELDKALNKMRFEDRCVSIAANERIWVRCVRGEWLIRAAGYVGVPPQRLVLAACACARDVLRFVPAGDPDPLRAIELAEAWARGEDVTKEQLRAAAYAAYAADAAAAAVYATYYAYAAAADAAYAATYAAAAYAATATAYVADAFRSAYSEGPSRADARRRMADIVRSVIAYSEIQRLNGFSEVKGFGDPQAELPSAGARLR